MPLRGALDAVETLGGLRGIWISPRGLAAISVDAVAAWLYTHRGVTTADWQWAYALAADLGLHTTTRQETTGDVTTYRLS